MAISEEVQQLMSVSQSTLKKILSQEEINGLTYYISVSREQGDDLSAEEKASLEKFFEKAVNNQALNKKLSKAMESLAPEMGEVSDALAQVRSFCYKTRFIDNVDGINKKTIRNLELLENNQTVKDSEKIHLSEIGMMTDTLKSQDMIDFLDQNGLITPGGALDKVKSGVESSRAVLQRLNKTVDSGMDVQSGDIYLTHTNKQNALMNRDPKSFFEKAKNHVTKYQHAATLYKRDDATILGMYGTYIDQVENYLNYADSLRDLHTQEFTRLYEAGQLTEEVMATVDSFNQENNMSIDALREKITEYDGIAQGGELTPKDFENILKEMQPWVDDLLAKNNDSRATDHLYAVLPEAGLAPEEQNRVWYSQVAQAEELANLQGNLLNDLYNLNNITLSLDKPRVSHIDAEYEQYDLSTEEALMSNQYRIDPIKLIDSPETRQALQEKLGVDWEKQIRDQFSEIAGNVHGNTNFNIINDLDRMISAGLADYGLASDAGVLHPEVGLKGEVAESVMEKIPAGMGDIKFGNKGHTNNEVEANKFEHLRNRMLGRDGEEHSATMLCSEFAVKAALTSIVELNDRIAEQTGIEKALNIPVDNKEALNRVHPQRLLELLESSGCVEEIKNPLLEQLVDTSNHKKNFSAKENTTKLLYERVSALANETRDNPDKFVKDASVIFKAYMKAENPEHNRSDQEMNDMLKPALIDLHSTYNTRHPEKFTQKLKQLAIKVKEFCGKKLGYEYKSVRSGVTNILKTSAVDKPSEGAASPNPMKDQVRGALKESDLKKHLAENNKDNPKKPSMVERVSSRGASKTKQER